MADSLFRAEQKQTVVQRAQTCCEYCISQVKFSPDPFSIEHIIPKSKGGTDKLDNPALACQGCNNRKYTHTEAIDPVTGSLVPLYHPRLQDWAEHFVWSENFTRMIGITPTERATLDRLDLNREGIVKLREVLSLINRHPPF